MALESYAHEQRKLPLWHVLAAEQVHRVDGRTLRRCPTRESRLQLRQTWSRRKARVKNRAPQPESAKVACSATPRALPITRAEWIELQFRNKCVLPQLETFGDAPRYLPRRAEEADPVSVHVIIL